MVTISSHIRLALPGDGVMLAADAYGETAAPPVFFFHGGGQSRRSWTGTARMVARAGYRGITVDLRGHGESGWAADGDYFVDAYARDVEHLLAWAGRPAALVGASRGGQAAFIAASRHPKQVSLVMLADVAPWNAQSGLKRIFKFLAESLDGYTSVDEAADALAHLLERPRVADASGLAKMLRTAPDGRLFWQWDPATAKPDFLAPPEEEAAMVAAARRITCPTVLVRGSLSDLVPPENAARFKALMPHLVMVEAQGAGHMFTGDRNDAFGATLLEYLRKFAPV